MIEYGKAFYGSDEIGDILCGHSGKCLTKNRKDWSLLQCLKFTNQGTIYKLPKNHWFYDSDEFKRAKKPGDEIDKPLADYSDNELQTKIKSMQDEIERRKSQDEVTILARQICADNFSITAERHIFIEGKRDDWHIMNATKAGIIAGMELRRG